MRVRPPLVQAKPGEGSGDGLCEHVSAIIVPEGVVPRVAPGASLLGRV
jgi:hypothetical protein